MRDSLKGFYGATVRMGGPVILNFQNARRGSPWGVKLTFTKANGTPMDLSNVTQWLLELKTRAKDSITPTLSYAPGDFDTSLSGVGVLRFNKTKTQTLAVPPAAYVWDLQANSSTGEAPDGWCPVGGLWTVVERVSS